MPRPLLLHSNEATLVFELINPIWLGCSLDEDDTPRRFLGAENPQIVLSRLLRWLESHAGETDQTADTIEGQHLSWILSLAEAHHVFYGHIAPTNKTLFIRDCGGLSEQQNASIHLSPSLTEQWIQEVKGFLATL